MASSEIQVQVSFKWVDEDFNGQNCAGCCKSFNSGIAKRLKGFTNLGKCDFTGDFVLCETCFEQIKDTPRIPI